MKAINNFESVQATTGEFDRPKAGGYIVQILNVVNVELDASTGKGDYLRIDYDIADGEFIDYYQEQNERFGGEYRTNFIRSYKEKALGMFKHFINCLEESNPQFKWNWNERALIGLKLGVVLQEEEYEKNDGKIGTRLKVKDIKTVHQILEGDYKVPETKRIGGNSASSYNPYSAPNFEDISTSDDLPF